MSSRILTSYVSSFDVFTNNPCNILDNSKDGTVAIFIDNAPVFYAISTQRLAQLLEIEARFSHPESDVTLDHQLYEEQIDSPTITPTGKFAMYPDWKPDSDFQKQASLWGIFLTYEVTSEELTAFIAYWQAEGKMFHHVQWQQKLARSVLINRSRDKKYKHDINIIPEIDNQIPIGFRG